MVTVVKGSVMDTIMPRDKLRALITLRKCLEA